MIISALLLGVAVLLMLFFIGLKLRGRFLDLDRRLDKIDANFQKVFSSILNLQNNVNERSLEIQNSQALSNLSFDFPVFFGGWSIDSFLGKYLVQHLLVERPKVIVELGSGSSSILIAKCAEKLSYTPVHIVVDH